MKPLDTTKVKMNTGMPPNPLRREVVHQALSGRSTYLGLSKKHIQDIIQEQLQFTSPSRT